MLENDVLFNQKREKICNFWYILEPVDPPRGPTNTLRHWFFIALVAPRLGSYVRMGRYLYEYGLMEDRCFHQYKFVYYDVDPCSH